MSLENLRKQYEYDRKTGIEEIEPVKLKEGLNPKLLTEEEVKKIIEPDSTSSLEDDEDD